MAARCCIVQLHPVLRKQPLPLQLCKCPPVLHARLPTRPPVRPCSPICPLSSPTCFTCLSAHSSCHAQLGTSEPGDALLYQLDCCCPHLTCLVMPEMQLTGTGEDEGYGGLVAVCPSTQASCGGLIVVLFTALDSSHFLVQAARVQWFSAHKSVAMTRVAVLFSVQDCCGGPGWGAAWCTGVL